MSVLASLSGRTWDLVVIGGGVAGAGIARDAAMRGLSTLLLERRDFASGTTSKSSKLIHGGLRYLELFDFALVRECLVERERLARLAPHLVRPLPFLVPVYRDARRGMVMVRIGMKLYDLLTPGKRTEHSRTVSAAEALAMEPNLNPESLQGAGYYFDDLLLLPERLCLENALSARRWGARILNYVEVEGFSREEEGWALTVSDAITGEAQTVRGRVVINAAGPWVDRVRGLAGVKDAGRRVLRTTKGSHILIPRITDQAVYSAAKRDERMFFVIPWREFSLIGTTDTDYADDLDRVVATKEDVTYLLTETQRTLPGARVGADKIVYTYAGTRPLTYEAGKPESAVSRQHRVFAEADGTFLSVTGVKLTCFRSQAEGAVDQVERTLGRRSSCRTIDRALDGGDAEPPVIEVHTWLDATAEQRVTGLDSKQIERLLETYGRGATKVLALAKAEPTWGERLCPSSPEIVAQVVWACREELARTLPDFMFRRTNLGGSRCLGQDCAPAVARVMARELQWSPSRLEAELEAYARDVAAGQAFRER